MKKKVFVSGCYDMLHSGHVAFFEEAAQLGDLYVGIGSDATIYQLKSRKTINTEDERLYMVKALKAVKDAWINRGSGLLDFVEEVKNLKPDIFFVNSDGHTPAKEQFCKEHNIQYVVSKRVPHGNLPTRSTTALRKECKIPYRIDLAGGWLDQVYINKFGSGPVITLCIEPTIEFNDRSGMASSSRKKAIELWQTDVPSGDKEKLAKMLFCFENPPGTKYVSGSQDAIGIVMPGLNRLEYDNDFWPKSIKNETNDELMNWIEKRIWIVPLYPRKDSYDVDANSQITKENIKLLSDAAQKCWDAILDKNVDDWGKFTTESFEAQIRLFPNMAPDDVLQTIERYKNQAKGWKISGAGGGGYLILISETPIEYAFQIKIRR
jgi:cytidyltransferase-like protein